MKLESQIARIAEIIVSNDDYQYIHDPEHRNRPHGKFWPTEKGWSNDPKYNTDQNSSNSFDNTMKSKKFTKPPQAKDATLVWLDTKALEDGFKKNDGYVGVGGQGGIGNRYNMFKNFFEKNQNIYVPEIVIKPNNEVEFVNGRHRYSFMRDQGATSIPVALYQGDGVLSLNDVMKRGFQPKS